MLKSLRKKDPDGGKKPDGHGSTVILMTATLHRKSTQNNIPISRYPFTIGRIAKFCDYAVEEDGAISKRHVTILLRNGQAYIRDNASTNGTKLNGLPIPPNTDVELPSGATFQIGKEEFVLITNIIEKEQSAKKIAAINDLSGIGRCSLSVALPIISALKVQCCPFPRDK